MDSKSSSIVFGVEERHILAFIRGDQKAFHHVYAAHRQRVLSYCIFYIGDETLAKDAFQEVFLKIHTSRTQLREPKALGKWILMITRSVCLNIIRKRRSEPEFIALDEDVLTGVANPSYTEMDLDADDLRIALAKLPLMYREAFLLREFEGYEYEEIARLTNTSIPNMQVRLTRAKSMLRELLMPSPKTADKDMVKPRVALQDKAVGRKEVAAA